MEPERKCLHKMLKLLRKDEIAQGIIRVPTFLVSLLRQHFTFPSHLNVKATSVCTKAIAFGR